MADGPVFVMKTAGQPERRVKVIKTDTLPDGTTLTDVKDLATGVVYTLTNPAVLDKPAANTAAAPRAEAATQLPATTGTVAPSPGTPRPIFGSFPNQPQTVAKTPTVAKPTAGTAGAPRPIFGAFPNQSQPAAVTPGLRTAAGERLIPAEGMPPVDGNQSLPHARSRKTDPLLAGASTTPAAIAGRTPFVSIPPGSPPSVLGKILGEPEQPVPQPRVGVLPKPTTNEDLGAPPTMLPPPTYAATKPLPKPLPEPVVVAKVEPTPKPTPKAATTEGLAIPSIDPNARPTAATGIFDSQPPTTVPAAAVEKPSAVAEKPSVALPPIDATTPAPERVIPPIVDQPAPAAPKLAPPPAAEPPAVLPPAAIPSAVPVAAMPTPAVEPAPRLLPPPTVDVTPKLVPPPVVDVPAIDVPPIEPAAAVLEAPKAVMNGVLPADVQAMIEGLKTHRRPSYRMENATSLGESAYAKHPDVLAALMQAARTDATGVVRGHCISQLAAVGYSDATFVQLLDSWTNDSEPAVRRAAAAAKTKLTGR